MAELSSLIQADHRKVEALFAEILSTPTDAVDRREALFTELHRELTIHAYLEEALFYPEMKQHSETEKWSSHVVAEHIAMKGVLAKLQVMDKGNEDFIKQVQTLQTAIADHVVEEETEVLPAAERSFNPRQLAAMAEQFRRGKEDALRVDAVEIRHAA